eukprot:scaffold4685_cov234-Chaetoceros_neogracile.AAC.5
MSKRQVVRMSMQTTRVWEDNAGPHTMVDRYEKVRRKARTGIGGGPGARNFFLFPPITIITTHHAHAKAITYAFTLDLSTTLSPTPTINQLNIMTRAKRARAQTGNVRKEPIRDTQKQYRHTHGLSCVEPDAIVVLNGLLPRTNDPSRYLGDSHDGEIIAPRKKDEQFQLVDGNRMNQTENGRESIMDAHSTSSLENAAETDDIEAEIDDIEADSVSSTTTSTASSHRTSLQSIQSINKGLASYAHQHDRVEYFDASDIFVAHLGSAHYHCNASFLMKRRRKKETNA